MDEYTVTSAVAPVPLLDLKRQYYPLREELAEVLVAVNESGQYVLGPEVRRLEAAVARANETKFGVGCASGSDALLLALMAVGVRPGDEVIVPSFTFFATASCVPRLGAVPVFADIDPVTFNLSVDDVRRKITSKTKAIIPVHLYGQMADMKGLLEITKLSGDPERQKIALIEDAAQAILSMTDDRPIGNWGDMACLSFYPTKNLGGAGDGGMVIINDSRWAERVRLLRGHGMEPRYYHKEIGVNSRLDSYQAAVLNVKLPHLTQWTRMRRRNARHYTELFSESLPCADIVLPTTLDGRFHVWNQYVVRIPGGLRDTLRAELTEKKIGTEVYYPLGLHQQECFRYLGYAPQSLPETYRASQEVLALPMFPELTAEERVRVVEAIESFFVRGHGRNLFPAAAVPGAVRSAA